MSPVRAFALSLMVLLLLTSLPLPQVRAQGGDSLGIVRFDPPSGEIRPVGRKQRLKPGNSVKVWLRYALASSEQALVEVDLLADEEDVRYRRLTGGAYVARGRGTVAVRTGVRCRKRSPAVIRLTRLSYRLWEVDRQRYKRNLLDEGTLAVNFRVRCPARGAPPPSPTPDSRLPDLVITGLTVPARAEPGEAIGPAIRIEVTNRGRGRARTRDGFLAHIDLVLSSDRRIERLPARVEDRFVEDVLLVGGRLQIREDLRPGERVRLRGEGRLPRRLRPGRYYLCAAVDSNRRVRESREDNNVACAPLTIGRMGPPPPPPLREDCVGFDPDWLEVDYVRGRWKVVELLPGGRRQWLLDFPSRREAERALRILRYYGANRMCFVGRPYPSLTYILRGRTPPEGYLRGEDCVRFRPADLEVVRIRGRWKLVDDRTILLDFGAREDEAYLARRIIRRYGFRYLCFVGRPDPDFTYLRR